MCGRGGEASDGFGRLWTALDGRVAGPGWARVGLGRGGSRRSRRRGNRRSPTLAGTLHNLGNNITEDGLQAAVRASLQ